MNGKIRSGVVGIGNVLFKRDPLPLNGALGISGSIFPSRTVRILRIKPADAMAGTPFSGPDGGGYSLLEPSRTALVSLFSASFYKPSKESARNNRALPLPLPARQKKLAEKQAGNQATDWREPTEEGIRKRAYELYRQREREFGGSLDDWLEAEAELLLRRRSESP